MSEARRLCPDDAEALVEFEQSYPSALREGLEKIQRKLTLLDSTQFSFAWGLFEKDVLVAHVIAYPRKSMIEGMRHETVLYIDDLYVAPEATQYLYRLLKVLQFDFEEANLGHLHVEAVSRRSFFRLVEQHPDVFTRLGYEVLGHYAFWDEEVGEEMFWARYAPYGKGTAAQRDQVQISDEVLEEMRLGLD